MRTTALLLLLTVASGCAAEAAATDPAAGTARASYESTGKRNVDVEGLLSAMVLYSNGAYDQASAGHGSGRNAALVDATWQAMQNAEAGELDADAEELLRSQVVPLLSSLERARIIAARVENTCPSLVRQEGEILPHLMRRAAAEYSDMGRFEGGYRAGFDALFARPQAQLIEQMNRADCGEQYLALTVVTRSAAQALANLLQMRATFIPGELARIARDPEGYVRSYLVSRMPASLSRFEHTMLTWLTPLARALAAGLDEETTAEIRSRTVEGFGDVVRQVRDAASERRETHAANPWGEYGGFFPHWCRAQLQARGHFNVLLLSDTAYERVCGGSYWTFQPTERDLVDMTRELGGSVEAYLDKLGEAWDEDQGRETLKYAMHNNVAGIAAALQHAPQCVAAACRWFEWAEAEREREAFWDEVILWGTAIVGVVALATGVGAWAAGALGAAGLVAAGTAAAAIGVLGAISTGASIAGIVISLYAIPHLAARGAQMLWWAEQDLASVMVSGADPADVRAEVERARALIEEACITGVFTVFEAAQVMRALRLRLLRIRGEAQATATLGTAEESLRSRNRFVESLAEEYGESQERVRELASDAAHGGRIKDWSRREARVALFLEREGELVGVRRYVGDGLPSGTVPDFVDDAGVFWDEHRFNRSTSLRTKVSQIGSMLDDGSHVIVNTTLMTPEQVQELLVVVRSRGWAGRVKWYPGIVRGDPGLGGLLITAAARTAGGAPGAEGDPGDPGEAGEPGATGEPPGAASELCSDTCGIDLDGGWANDGECDDGGPGSAYNACPLGTDCADCGARSAAAGEGERDDDEAGDAAPPAGALCTETCTWAGDGVCDDGGPGAAYTACELGTDCADCGARDPVDDAPAPPPPMTATGLCSDGCAWASDGVCDDGGPGAATEVCAFGTDCTDCGGRDPADAPSGDDAPPDAPAGTLCTDECAFPSDGVCDDGGAGSSYAVCEYGTDCADCGARDPADAPVAPEPAPEPLCSNDCRFANDGECDDGGPGSMYAECDLGTDCADCGPR